MPTKTMRWVQGTVKGLRMLGIVAVAAFVLLPSTATPQNDIPASIASPATVAGCGRAYAAPALEPLRKKMPLGFLAVVTDEMRANEAVPNARERAALSAYSTAFNTCSTLFGAELLHDPSKTQHPPPPVPDEEFVLLQQGTISYADYFRRQDKRSQAFMEALKARKPSAPSYESTVENWLAPFKPNHPAGTPWWGFYSDAITTARDVDSGKISEQQARDLIEARRVKLNEEVASGGATSGVNLNCQITNASGAVQEIVIGLDYANKRVGQVSATYTEASVNWTVGPNSNGVVYHYALNRLSGFLNVGSDQFASLWTGRCAPAKRQF